MVNPGILPVLVFAALLLPWPECKENTDNSIVTRAMRPRVAAAAAAVTQMELQQQQKRSAAQTDLSSSGTGININTSRSGAKAEGELVHPGARVRGAAVQPRSSSMKVGIASAASMTASQKPMTRMNAVELAQYKAVKTLLPKLFVVNGQTWQLVDGLFANIPANLKAWLPKGAPSSTQDYSEFVPKRGQGYISLTAAKINSSIYITEVYAYGAGLDLTQLPELVARLPQIASFTCKSCLYNRKNITASSLPENLPRYAPSTFKTLYLGGCMVQGSLPGSWGKWTNIEQIMLWENALTGPLPSAWANMTSLKVLNIEQNNITGTLPALWGYGTMQKNITMNLLSNQQLSGSVPSSWGRFTGTLDVSNTQITGCVPDGLVKTVIMDVYPETCGSNGPAAEYNALRNIRNIMQHAWGTELLTSWRDDGVEAALALPGTPPMYCTSWAGIQCDSNNKVISLDLSQHQPAKLEVRVQLSGMMEQVKRFGSLRVLNLSTVALNGALSDERPFSGDLSNLAADLPYLQILDLSGNAGLTGQLPRMWAGLTALQQLNLSGTSLTGTLPYTWAALQSLKSFTAAGTQIDGTLPGSWGMLKQLEVLDVSNTNIIGRLPAAWADPMAMQQIAVAALEGARSDAAAATAATAAIKNSIRSLGRGLCHGQASVPPASGSTAVSQVAAAAVTTTESQRNLNQEAIADIVSDVSNRSLTAAVQRFQHAQQSAATATKITSQLQQTLASRLSTVSVAMATVAQPTASLGMNKLQVLRLANNTLTGSLPASFSSFGGMRLLDLSYNSLTGSLPMQWAAMDNLEELLLDGNRLSGSLPDYWARLTNLRTLNLSNNSLTGQLPSTWVAMHNVQILDLSSNKFTGGPPPEWELLAGPNYHLQCLLMHDNPYMDSSNLRQMQAHYQQLGSRLRMILRAQDIQMCQALHSK